MSESVSANYDAAWKGALERYLEEFMAYFFPKAWEALDWERGYEFLDRELSEIIPLDSESGQKRVDVLVKAWEKEKKEETWIALHIEIQSQEEREFGKRMLRYNYRLYDRYDREVVSLAVLGDENPNWRENEWVVGQKWGSQLSLRYPIAKLLDYAERVEEEERNPFGLIVKAHLATKATQGEGRARLREKIGIIRELYRKGLSREEVVALFGLIDWMMALPKEEEREFREEVRQLEEEEQMRYVTSVERVIIEEEREEAKAEGLVEGKAEGKAEGLLEGQQEGKLTSACALLDTTELGAAQIATILKLPEEVVTELADPMEAAESELEQCQELCVLLGYLESKRPSEVSDLRKLRERWQGSGLSLAEMYAASQEWMKEEEELNQGMRIQRVMSDERLASQLGLRARQNPLSETEVTAEKLMEYVERLIMRSE